MSMCRAISFALQSLTRGVNQEKQRTMFSLSPAVPLDGEAGFAANWAGAH